MPDLVSLQGRVDLQGRPSAPNARWETSLAIDLHNPFDGALIASYATVTDQSGAFVINDIVPGNYQVGVKSRHSLQTGTTVDLRSGDAQVDFGVLLEGDANNDNVINLWDFSLWRRYRGECQGSRGFNPNTDFDQSNCTDLDDGRLLFRNFGLEGSLEGSILARASDGRDAAILPVALIQDRQAGEQFSITLTMMDGEGNNAQVEADSSAIHLRFQDERLRVLSVTGHPQLETTLEYNIDNEQGHIDFAAATLDGSVQFDGELVTVVFEAVEDIRGSDSNDGAAADGDSVDGNPAAGNGAASDAISIEMVRSGPNASDLTLNGTSLIAGEATGQSLFIVGDGLTLEDVINPQAPELTERLFLPLTTQ